MATMMMERYWFRSSCSLSLCLFFRLEQNRFYPDRNQKLVSVDDESTIRYVFAARLPPSTSTSIARTLPPTSLLMAKILASSSIQRIEPLLSTIKISPSYNYTAFSTEWKLDEIFVNVQHRSSHHLLFIQISNLKR